jgi:AcrR family transcriptional regulator
MRVRDWDDILEDVTESGADPEGWRAVAGDRAAGVGEDFYLGHPNAGVYLLKTYAKNPMQVRGVGTRVARRVDDGIDPFLPSDHGEEPGRFAVQSPPEDEDQAEDVARRLEETVRVHAEAPTTPEDFFTDLMEAVDSPAYGPMRYEFDDRPGELDDLATTFEEAEELLDAELDDLVEADEVGRGFQ